MRKGIITILLLLLTLGVIGCQDNNFINLRGRIEDRFTGEPLAGVQVEVGDRLVETNTNGYFIVKDIPVVEDVKVEDRMIKVAAPGYRVYAKPITLKEGDTSLEIKLDTKKESKFFFVSDKDGSYNIYMSNIYAKQVNKLTDNQANNWAPDWSEKREELLFLSDRNGHTNIYTMKVDGSNLKQITHTTSDKENPIWIGEDRIIFASNRDGDYELYQMDLAENYLRRLTNNSYYDGQPAYSSVREEILYISETTREQKLHLMKQDGTDKFVLYNGFGEDSHPSWSKDGKNVLFTNLSSGQSNIYQVNPNGSGLIKILTTKNKIYDYAVWNLDKELILYVVQEEGSKNLKLLTSQGNKQALFVDYGINYTNPQWKE